MTLDRTRYNEYVLCLKNNDGEEDSCKKYFQLASSLCPSSWVRPPLYIDRLRWEPGGGADDRDAAQVERWETEREEGNFTGVQFPKN